MRRIVFLGVIANKVGYQKPFPSNAAAIRKLRAERLKDNWKRRREKQAPRLSPVQLRDESERLYEDFVALESRIANRIRNEHIQARRGRWDEIISEMGEAKQLPGAYHQLMKEESPRKSEDDQPNS